MAKGSTVRLTQNSYGKSRVRVLKVSRENGRHDIRELTVDIALSGDFEDVHTRGDNAKCLPTDTMKNTVYAMAKDDPIDSIESFAERLAAHFVGTHRPASEAKVNIASIPWDRADIGGKAHPHCYTRGSDERALCEVTLRRGGEPRVRSGLSGLVILKSADSAFSGFPRDRYTTLKETEDRVFCTSISAWWAVGTEADHNSVRASVRDAMIEMFAGHKSKSVQHTLYAMGEAVLARCESVQSISMSMPNKHYLLVDMTPIGIQNQNEVFVPTDEPHGLIEATVERTEEKGISRS